MTCAYGEEYINDAMSNLGEAFDYAVNACGIEINTFMDLFIASGLAEAFGKGVAKIVSGLSGTELVMETVRKSGAEYRLAEPQTEYDNSPEYWCGWVLAYFQWKTGRSFKDIVGQISMNEVLKLYPTLHEASEDKFVDTVNAIIKRKSNPTRLQVQRKKCGLSQRELCEKSGVNLRTLQQYEMRAKDINKASVSTLMSLASVLSCRVDDLTEFTIDED